MVSNISPPEEVQKAIDARSSMAAVGDLRSYTIFQAANGMAAAGQNPGAGAGLGLGMGMLLPNVVEQAFNQPPAPVPATAVVAGTSPSQSATLDFSNLQPAKGSITPKQLIESLAKQSNWQISENNEVMELTIPLGSLRRQKIFAEFNKKDSDGHALISFLDGVWFGQPEQCHVLTSLQ